MSSVGGVMMTICSVLSARARTVLLLGGGALLLLTVNACRTGADYRVDARGQEVRNDLAAALPDLGSDDLAARREAQQALQERCWDAARPEQADTRRVLSRALADALLVGVGNTVAKAFIIDQLRWIGGGEAVAALTLQLSSDDGDVRDHARRALAANPLPAAGDALAAQFGLVRDPAAAKALLLALAYRGETRWNRLFLEVLEGADTGLCLAALEGLKRTADRDALEGLNRAAQSPAKAVRDQVREALLRLADRLCVKGDKAAALVIYEQLLQDPQPVRCAAIIGTGRAGGVAQLPLLFEILEGDDAAAKGAARTALGAMAPKVAVPAVVSRIGAASPGLKAELLTALADGGYPESLPVFLAAAEGTDETVRLAAIEGCGRLGSPEAAPMLVHLIASGSTPVSTAAKNALAWLPGDDDVVEAVAAAMPDADTNTRRELVDALNARRSSACLDLLLQTAREDEDQGVRILALEGIGTVGESARVAALIPLLLAADAKAEKEAIQKAMVAISRRTIAVSDVTAAVLEAIDGAPKASRMPLLRVLGLLGGDQALGVVRQALKDEDPDIRTTAIRALGEWPDMAAATDLLTCVSTGNDITSQVLALRGYVRLIRDVCPEPPERKVRLYQAMMDVAPRNDDKTLVLAGLGEAPCVEALALAQRQLGEAALVAEAAVAVTQIAETTRWTAPVETAAALHALVAAATTDDAKSKANGLLELIAQYDGYLQRWLLAGPYTQDKKEGGDLLDIAFPPEAETAAGVTWQGVSTGTKPGTAWAVPIDEVLSGNNRAAYLKSMVWMPGRTEARLEAGSDDGLKAWLNGTQILVNNAARAIAPGQDRADVVLEKGWNTLLLKITQGSGFWAGAARFTARDGSRLDGLVALADARAAEVACSAAADTVRGADGAFAVVASTTDAATKKTVLKAIVAAARESRDRERAASMLQALEAEEDHILQWALAGPYTVPGKQGMDLLDVPLGPEVDADAVTWTAANASVEPHRPWVVDLIKAFGGNDRAAYMRAVVISDADRDARLEIGSDDGVKAWVNGKLVHSHAVSRPVRPAEDGVSISLRKGSNVLLMKVVQGNGGWGGCARVRAPGGGHADGIRYATP